MAKKLEKIFIDRRVLVNGLQSAIYADNFLDLLKWIQQAIDDEELVIDAVSGGYALDQNLESTFVLDGVSYDTSNTIGDLMTALVDSVDDLLSAPAPTPVSGDNGLSDVGSEIHLGGDLLNNTLIDGLGAYNIVFENLTLLQVLADSIEFTTQEVLFDSTTADESGVKFANINSSTTPVVGQPIGVDADGKLVVINFSTPTCDPVIFNVNSLYIGDIACGDTFDLQILDENDDIKGTFESPDIIRISNSILQFDGADVDIITPESTFNLLITQGGVTFTGWGYNDISKTLNIDDCPSCNDSTLQFNGTLAETITSGATLNVNVTLDGSATTPTYNAGTNTLNVSNPAKSGSAYLPLGRPQQLAVINNGDCGWAFQQNAYMRTIDYTKANYQELDNTDPYGATLLYPNSFGNYARFTNDTGVTDTTYSTNVLCGDAVTRTASTIIDHFYGTVLYYINTTGVWSVQCSRAFNATESGVPVYFASVDIAVNLYTNHSALMINHLQRVGITLHANGCFFGETVPGTTNSYGYLSSGIIGSLSQAGARAMLLFRKL